MHTSLPIALYEGDDEDEEDDDEDEEDEEDKEGAGGWELGMGAVTGVTRGVDCLRGKGGQSTGQPIN